MKLNIFTIITLSLLAFSAPALAEAPCTHVGQESLQAAAACVRYSRASDQLLDTHHTQVLANMAAEPYVPPHPYPYGGYYPSMMPYFMVGTIPMKGMHRGFQNAHLMWPNSWYMAYPGW